MTCGLIDHDSIGGAEEFLTACHIVGIPGTVGLECRATMKDTPFAQKKFNNPDQAGMTYITIHGVPHDQTAFLNQQFAPRQGKAQPAQPQDGGGHQFPDGPVRHPGGLR